MARTVNMLWLVLLLVITGALNTILLKLQNCQEIAPGISFNHPLCQLLAMFLGESLALIPYFLLRRRASLETAAQGGYRKPKVQAYAILTPALLDLLASLLGYVALTMLPSSVWQMLKGGVILTTLAANRLIYKVRPGRHGYIGCGIAFLGILTVGLVSFFTTDRQSGDPVRTLVGLGLVLVSLGFTGIQFAYQQQLFKVYDLTALELVGFEGLFGLSGSGLLLALVSVLDCPFPVQDCVAYGHSYHMDSIFAYFQDLLSNGWLAAFCIVEVFTMACSVVTAVTVTKRIDATSRSLADVSRTVLIWGFGLGATSIGLCKMEQLRLLPNLLQLGGFVVLVVGVLVYHQVIRVGERMRVTEVGAYKRVNQD